MFFNGLMFLLSITNEEVKCHDSFTIQRNNVYFVMLDKLSFLIGLGSQEIDIKVDFICCAHSECTGCDR